MEEWLKNQLDGINIINIILGPLAGMLILYVYKKSMELGKSASDKFKYLKQFTTEFTLYNHYNLRIDNKKKDLALIEKYIEDPSHYIIIVTNDTMFGVGVVGILLLVSMFEEELIKGGGIDGYYVTFIIPISIALSIVIFRVFKHGNTFTLIKDKSPLVKEIEEMQKKLDELGDIEAKYGLKEEE